MDTFFKSKIWEFLKETKHSYRIAYELINRRHSLAKLFFIDDSNIVVYDPMNSYKEMNDFERTTFHNINRSNSTDLYQTDRFYFLKIGSSVGYGPISESTETVYDSTFIPFDSDF